MSFIPHFCCSVLFLARSKFLIMFYYDPVRVFWLAPRVLADFLDLYFLTTTSVFFFIFIFYSDENEINVVCGA